MARLKRYKMTSGFDLSVTVEVDHDKLDRFASEICNFWIGGEDVIEAADGDLVEAAIRLAGQFLLNILMDKKVNFLAQREFDDSEGWPPNGEHGIRIIDFEIPDPEAEDLEFEELGS